MSAIITLLYDGKKKSIQMEVQPDESLEDILERCIDYWMLDDESRYAFFKRNTELSLDESVITAGIERGDVLRLVDKDKEAEDEGIPDDAKNGNENTVNVAEEWLEKNIGLDGPSLNLVDKKYMDEGIGLTFKISGKKEYVTVQVRDGKVRNYIPKNIMLEKD